MGKKGTPHRKYSKEEKMKYVHLHLEEHMSLRQIEKEYGIGNALVGHGSKSIWRTVKMRWSRIMAIHMQLCIEASH